MVLYQADSRRVSVRPFYRVRQFLLALCSRARPVDESAVSPYLNPLQAGLFQRMPPAEQQHALAVLRTLQSAGPIEASLAQAALLHDVGKVQGHIRLWHRVIVVLVQALVPSLLKDMALDQPGGWRYPFYVQSHHAQRGAAMAVQVGVEATAVALIGAHHTLPAQDGLGRYEQNMLAKLQAADGAN